jgi:hypothetical protein
MIMIKRSQMIPALVLAVVTWSCSVSADDREVERVMNSTWRMDVDLDTPKLKPPAVQWTVLDKDPVPGFRSRVGSMRGYHRKRLAQAENESEKEMIRSSQMRVSWDLGFKQVTGDKVYLMTSARSSLGSNSPDGKKWIVTKVVDIKGKPVCWCIPVKVKTGESIEITLTEDNQFDLESAFDKAMEKSTEDE